MSAEPSVDVVSIPTSAGSLPGLRWLPAGGTGAGVVVCQEIFGVSAYIRSRCADLARLGYVVLAPRFYDRLGLDEVGGDGDDLEAAVAASQRIDWPRAVADGVAAVAHVRGAAEVTGDVGVLGFCWGGGLAFAIAAAGSGAGAPDALVSYYGSSLPQQQGDAARVTAPSLHHFGLADPYLPPETVAELTASLGTARDVTVETYAGAGHAFDNPHPGFHHAAAAAAAWAATTEFLRLRLRPARTSSSE